MNKFAELSAKYTSEIVQSSGMDGYEIGPEGLVADLTHKAQELAELLSQGETPEQHEVGGPLVDLHEMVQGMLEAYPELPDQ